MIRIYTSGNEEDAQRLLSLIELNKAVEMKKEKEKEEIYYSKPALPIASIVSSASEIKPYRISCTEGRSNHHKEIQSRKYFAVSRECLLSSNLNENTINYAKISYAHPKVVMYSNGNDNRNEIIDLRSHFPAPFDQGQLGSCTANALCSIVSYDIPNFMGSRLFLYYNERMIESHISEDTGALLSDGIKSLLEHGVCSESDWPYDVSKFDQKPSDECYRKALDHQALNVKPLEKTMEEMKNALRNGYPFVVGIILFSSFQSYEVACTGMVPLPSMEETMLGGHAVTCVGFDDVKKVWIMRNSWGDHWGDKGYFYLPYYYLLSNLAQDLWCITKMEI